MFLFYLFILFYLKIFKNGSPSGHIGTCFSRIRLQTTLKLQYKYKLNYNYPTTYISVKLHILLITNYKKTSAAVKNRFKFTKTFLFNLSEKLTRIYLYIRVSFSDKFNNKSQSYTFLFLC